MRKLYDRKKCFISTDCSSRTLGRHWNECKKPQSTLQFNRKYNTIIIIKKNFVYTHSCASCCLKFRTHFTALQNELYFAWYHIKKFIGWNIGRYVGRHKTHMNEERVEIIITEWDTIKGAADKQQCRKSWIGKNSC